MWAEVGRHARSMPEQPALLFPSTEEWCWISWSEWEERIERAFEELSGVAPGIRVGFHFRPEPRSLTRDLAIQAAGAVAVPVLPDGDSDSPVDLWWPEAGEEATGGSPRPEPRSRDGLGEATRGVCVEEGGSWSLWREGELRAAVGSVEDLLASQASVSRKGRELAYLSGCPVEPWERAFLAWCLEKGAALILAGVSELTGSGLAWSRPTVACLDEERLLEVEAALRSRGSLRRLARRYRRLHTLLLHGRIEESDPDRELWDRIGVRLARVRRPPVRRRRDP